MLMYISVLQIIFIMRNTEWYCGKMYIWCVNFGSEYDNITDRDKLNTEKYYAFFFSGIRKDRRQKEVVNEKSEDFVML
jgi:hypothetical protein